MNTKQKKIEKEVLSARWKKMFSQFRISQMIKYCKENKRKSVIKEYEELPGCEIWQ